MNFFAFIVHWKLYVVEIIKKGVYINVKTI